MLINEIYNCTQGEGLLLGVPSVLVRTNTCNLRCQWGVNKCDTEYTSWAPEKGEILTPQGVYDRVVDLARSTGIKHVILSGGEPTIQKDFLDVLHILATFFHVTIETNGTRPVDATILRQHPNILFSISPKLSCSTPVGSEWEKQHSEQRSNFPALVDLVSNYSSYLKFVVTSESDLVEVLDIEDALSSAVRKPLDIWLMAEGRTAEDVKAKAPWVIDQCIKYGFRYSPRAHLDVYGPKRRT